MYFFNPLSQEDEEDDGIFIGNITEDDSVNSLIEVFNKVLLKRFSLNESPPTGGSYFEYYVKKYIQEDNEDQNLENNDNRVNGPGLIRLNYAIN